MSLLQVRVTVEVLVNGKAVSKASQTALPEQWITKPWARTEEQRLPQLLDIALVDAKEKLEGRARG